MERVLVLKLQKLIQMDNRMKYVIDEIIDDIAKIENLDTKETEEVNLVLLPSNVKEGNVLIKDTSFKLDKITEKTRRSQLQAKLNRLKKGSYE